MHASAAAPPAASQRFRLAHDVVEGLALLQRRLAQLAALHADGELLGGCQRHRPAPVCHAVVPAGRTELGRRRRAAALVGAQAEAERDALPLWRVKLQPACRREGRGGRYRVVF